MSFWNNPENNSMKVLILVIVLAAVGAFAFYEKNSSEETTGRVIAPTTMGGSPMSGPAAVACGKGTKSLTAQGNCIEYTNDSCTASKPSTGCQTGGDTPLGVSAGPDGTGTTPSAAQATRCKDGSYSGSGGMCVVCRDGHEIVGTGSKCPNGAAGCNIGEGDCNPYTSSSTVSPSSTTSTSASGAVKTR